MQDKANPSTIFIHGYGTEGQAVLPYVIKKNPGAQIYIIEREKLTLPEAHSLLEEEAIARLKGIDIKTMLYLRSPGVPPTNPIIAWLDEHNVAHQTPLSYWLCEDGPEKVITITGSKGKSTTTALTAHLLKSFGAKAFMAGNVGITPFDQEIDKDTIAVLETSSFQLHDIKRAGHVHILTALYKDHIDWHGTMEAYAAAKMSPLALPAPPQSALISKQAAAFFDPQNYAPFEWLEDCLDEIPDDRLPADFQHNPRALNLKTALLAIKRSGFVDFDALLKQLSSLLEHWKGLPHRLEDVSHYGERLWIDDSLATIPEASKLALQQFPNQNIHLLIGGKNRGQNYHDLVHFVRGNPQITLHCFSETRALFDEFAEAFIKRYESFEKAIYGAYDSSHKGDVILFSPGAASAPPHHYYHVRSKIFKEIALNPNAHKQEAS